MELANHETFDIVMKKEIKLHVLGELRGGVSWSLSYFDEEKKIMWRLLTMKKSLHFAAM